MSGAILPANFVGFSPIIKKYLSEKKNDIIKEIDQLTDSKQDKKEFSTSLYSMRLTTDYNNLKEKFTLAFDEYL